MVSCGASVIKIILFIFNLLWLVLGGVVIWLGVTITVWSKDINELMDSNAHSGAIAVLVTGVLIFLVAFLGCCGACKESSCMLNTYGGIILILVVAQCVGIYFAFKNRTDVENQVEIGVDRELRKFLNSDDKNVARLVQSIQKTFKCCGTTGPDFYKTSTKWTLPPASCCGEDFGDNPLEAKCKADSKPYADGCVGKLKDTLYKYFGGLIGVAIALILVQLLVILSACCLSREVR